MNLLRLKQLASVSAVALSVAAFMPTTAWSAAFNMDNDTATIAVNAAVDNTADLVTTAVDFETIGVTSDAADTADLVMDPTTGAITDDLGAGVGGPGEAHIVSDDDLGTPGTATLTAALPNSQVFAYYSNPINLTDGAGPTLTLEVIQDDLATPGSFTQTGAVSVTGIGTTDGAGALSWSIGGTIQTVATAAPYDTNAYAGSFDMQLTY